MYSHISVCYSLFICSYRRSVRQYFDFVSSTVRASTHGKLSNVMHFDISILHKQRSARTNARIICECQCVRNIFFMCCEVRSMVPMSTTHYIRADCHCVYNLRLSLCLNYFETFMFPLPFVAVAAPSALLLLCDITPAHTYDIIRSQ